MSSRNLAGLGWGQTDGKKAKNGVIFWKESVSTSLARQGVTCKFAKLTHFQGCYRENWKIRIFGRQFKITKSNAFEKIKKFELSENEKNQSLTNSKNVATFPLQPIILSPSRCVSGLQTNGRNGGGIGNQSNGDRIMPPILHNASLLICSEISERSCGLDQLLRIPTRLFSPHNWHGQKRKTIRQKSAEMMWK